MLRWFLLVSLLVCGLSAVGWTAYQRGLSPVSTSTRKQLFEVAPGAGVAGLAEELADRRLIRSALAFRLYLREQGRDRDIKAGLYALAPAMGTRGVVEVLVEGQDVGVRLTFPEGWTIRKMAAKLEQRLPGTGRRFADLAAAAEAQRAEFPWLPALPPGASLEGFLFPDTYVITPGPDAAESLLRLMLSRFAQVALPALQAEGAPLDVYQRLVMASIVEKEAVHPDERPTISGVFYNRLTSRMPFGSDPTVEYALGWHQGDRGLSFKDVAIDSPYNTYKYPGLPPGPIANPGLASIRAAVQPLRTDMLYFVARGDGTHVFTRTYRDHLNAQAQIVAGRRSR
ncbi:MAG: endolytic transglycosylase MltG [Candidatus Sericytochromatia bacterium]|nr:endolytic transglycosylase MltG [Candidatus Sericytochromatia bacterium]